VDALRFQDWDDDRSLPEDERKFVSRVYAKALNWPDAKNVDALIYKQTTDGLSLGLDLFDPRTNCILRTLRADYSSFGLRLGEDDTNQFVTPLTSKQKEFVELGHDGYSGPRLAEVAADWFLEQICRVIERLEWSGLDHERVLYRLADTKRRLSSSLPIGASIDEPDRIELLQFASATGSET